MLFYDRNKLVGFSLSVATHPSLIHEASGSEALKPPTHLQSKGMVSGRRVANWLTVTNALAYDTAIVIAIVKEFYSTSLMKLIDVMCSTRRMRETLTL
jgi:hypothetical protein